MKYEVQIHFENKGLIQLHSNLDDDESPCDWLDAQWKNIISLFYCEMTNKIYSVSLNTVTAIVLTPVNPLEEYAPKERHEQEDGPIEYSQRNFCGQTAKTSGGYCS